LISYFKNIACTEISPKSMLRNIEGLLAKGQLIGTFEIQAQ